MNLRISSSRFGSWKKFRRTLGKKEIQFILHDLAGWIFMLQVIICNEAPENRHLQSLSFIVNSCFVSPSSCNSKCVPSRELVSVATTEL